eukprot:5581980-Prymnesium_polylepis.1
MPRRSAISTRSACHSMRRGARMSERAQQTTRCGVACGLVRLWRLQVGPLTAHGRGSVSKTCSRMESCCQLKFWRGFDFLISSLPSTCLSSIV